jgi:hypothetical protein
MHFCERRREDPGNLKTVRNLCESKDMGVIAVGGSDHRKVAIMDTFRTPYRLNLRESQVSDFLNCFSDLTWEKR